MTEDRTLAEGSEMTAPVLMAKSHGQEAGLQGGLARQAVWLWNGTEDGRGCCLNRWQLCMGLLGLSSRQARLP